MGQLSVWLGLAAELPEHPSPPNVATTWIELLPTDRPDFDDAAELARYDEWTALADLLNDHASDELATFGFPEGQAEAIAAFVAEAGAQADQIRTSPHRELVAQILGRLARIAPDHSGEAWTLAEELSQPPPSPFDIAAPPRRPISRELRRILDAPPLAPRSDEALVARVLRDL